MLLRTTCLDVLSYLRIAAQSLFPGNGDARAFLTAVFTSRLRKIGVRAPALYSEWVKRYDELSEQDRIAISRQVRNADQIWINVIRVLQPDENPESVAEFVRSLERQLYPFWTLTLFGSETQTNFVREEHDLSRINICARSTCTRDDAIPGQHVLIVFESGLLREHALYLYAREILKGADVIYADSDFLNQVGERHSATFRPGFSPEFGRQTNYMGSCIYLRTKSLAGSFEGNLLNIDMVVRAVSRNAPCKAVRIPFVLFHCFGMSEFCPRTDAVQTNDETFLSVSVIILTRDHVELLRDCISSLCGRTRYPLDRMEIIVVDNGSVEPEACRYLQSLKDLPGFRVLVRDEPFNYSRLNNIAAGTAVGEILVFLNNDIVIDDGEWLCRLTRTAARNDVGVVGGKLIYPDRTVQHGGVVVGAGGAALHANTHLLECAPGYGGLNLFDREMSAVTAACIAIRKNEFEEIGGFDECLEVAFSDVLLCLNAQQRGLKNIWLSTTLAIHHESKTRGADSSIRKKVASLREAAHAVSKFPRIYRNDPYYNPNLSLERPYELAFPPRVRKVWRWQERRGTSQWRALVLGKPRRGDLRCNIMRSLIRSLTERGYSVWHTAALPNSQSCGFLERASLRTAQDAADFAIARDIDCVIVFSQPFYSTPRLLGCGTTSLAIVVASSETIADDDIILADRDLSLTWTDAVQVVSSKISVDVQVATLAEMVETLCRQEPITS